MANLKTVGELKKFLENIPDDAVLISRAQAERALRSGSLNPDTVHFTSESTVV